MAYQSLYRRYRPRRFSEIKGQDHVVTALQTAVREGRVAHAYMLHGPRGTGKTTTARVLAKALNCEALGDDGEPCCECDSCESIAAGRSFDLHELDAASNNKVDDMRALLERVNLATPGRVKVYLLDEVHMLTTGAENALLKTLEEPPGHVTWVLATTEPHKVAQTIRSRCQVFELGLVNADVMAEHVREIAAAADLDVGDEEIDHALSDGGGSVRDTLTALDRVVSGGGTVELDSSTDAVLGALADHDVAAALAAVADAVRRGRNERTIGEMVLAGLRDAFLTTMGDPPTRLSESEHARAKDLAGRMTAQAMTRAMETLGRALIDMRQAPDPRVDIEVALVRLCRKDADLSLEGLHERLSRLEDRMTGTPGGAVAAQPPVAAAAASPPAAAHSAPPAQTASRAAGAHTPRRESHGPASEARRVLSERRGAAKQEGSAWSASPAPPAPTPPPPPPIPAAPAPAAPAPAASVPAGSVPSASASAPAVPVVDLASLRPQRPSEVVELAERHLGLGADVVVARAKEMLSEEVRRDPEHLLRLWHDLLDRHAPAAPDPSPAAGPPAEGVDPADTVENPLAADGPRDDHGEVPSHDAISYEPSAVSDDAPAPLALAHAEVNETSEPEDEYLGDITELAEAPSHAESVEQHIIEIFPGAEVRELHDADPDVSRR